MSHQSGIKPSNELNNDITFAKENNIRCFQIKIDGETLIMKNKDETVGSFSEDFDNCVLKYLEPDKCCYIFYRSDQVTQAGYEWFFFHWVPDDASIREKMLYASTKSTVKREFGDNYISEELTGHDKNDLLYSGYVKHIESKSAPPPLTMAEQDLIDIRKAERETALGDGQRTLKCSGFPPTDALLEELKQFTMESIDFLEMKISIAQETIEPDKNLKELECDHLCDQIHSEKSRYYLFRFRHEFENNDYKSIIFIYSMPGYTASVKERMLYSSCKAPFIGLLKSYFCLDIQRRLEVLSGDLSDLATESLLLDLHPPQVDIKAKFTKPKGPCGRGPKRLIRD